MSDVVVAVHAAFDEEALVWFVESSDLHGVNAEAQTLDALVAKLPDVILDLMDEGDAATDEDIVLEIVAHSVAQSGCGVPREGIRQAGPRPARRRRLPVRAAWQGRS